MAFWLVASRIEGTSPNPSGSSNRATSRHAPHSSGENRPMTHHRLRHAAGIRLDLVMRVRAAIAQGCYEEGALDACLDELLADLAA
jgi:hypothetical protein